MDSINTERSYTEYEVTTPTTDFAIGFDNYSGEDKDAIHATLDGVNLDDLDYTVVRKNAQVIEVTPAIESGVVRLQRETYIDQAFHKFTAGALFSPKSMDENFEQVRHSQQEVSDAFVYTTDYVNTTLSDYDARIVEVEYSQEKSNQRLDTEIQARKQGDLDSHQRLATEVQARKQGDLDSRRYAEDILGMGNIWDGISTRSVIDTVTGLTQADINAAQKLDTGITATAKFGGVERPLDLKLSEFVSVKDFGAVGDGVSDDTLPLNLASIYAGMYKRKLYFPAGTYMTKEGFTAQSNSYIFGDGKRSSTIKLFDGELRTTPMKIEQVTNVTVKGMGFDCDWQNRQDRPEGTDTYGGTSLLIRKSSFIVCEDVLATNPYRHSIDVTGSSYSVDGGNPDAYATDPSHHVWLIRCEAERGRDDGITTHQCSDIWITDCYSHDPLGGYVEDNNNCLEIDDGSRNIFVTNFLGVGGYEGIQIKGHATAAAPYNIHLTNITCVNNCIGFECRHTSFYGKPYSNTAKGIYINNMSIVAPAISDTWLNSSEITEPKHAVWIRSYQNVQINNLSIYLNDEQSNIAGDYLPTQALSGSALKITDGIRNLKISGLYITGKNWNTDDVSNRGVITLTNVETKDITITEAHIVDVGGYALYSTSTVTGVTLDNINIINSGEELETAYYVGSTDAYVGYVRTVGYTGFYNRTNNKIATNALPSGIGIGYEDNDTDTGFVRLNSNSSEEFGSSLRISRGGNLTLWYNNEKFGATLDASGGITLQNGGLRVSETNLYDIGEPSRLFKNIYATSGVVSTSDERLKQQFRSVTEREVAAALEIKASIRLFKFNAAVDLKGDGARWHVGVSAQNTVDIMRSHGLEPFDYSFICFDEWEASAATFDEDGNLESEAQEAGDKYAIRYDELAMFILATI